MIIEEIDESLFISRFEDYKRVTTNGQQGNFTYKGLRALFNYLDKLSEDTGEQIKLDVISLCCDYSEYKDLKEYINDYYKSEEADKKINEETLKDEFKKEMEEEINDKTTLIKFSDDLDEGFIIANY